MSGLAIITEACIDVKDRACVDVCPVQCIYEFDPKNNALFSEDQAGSGVTENTHQPTAEAIALFEDSILYVNTEECTSCTACYQPDVCPVGVIFSEENVPQRNLKDALRLRGSEQGSRPHVLHPAQPGRFWTRSRTASIPAACRHRLTVTDDRRRFLVEFREGDRRRFRKKPRRKLPRGSVFVGLVSGGPVGRSSVQL
jgi:ferredoxin